MDHIENVIQGTIELTKSFLEKIENQKTIDLQVAKTACKSRLNQILSVMTMNNAPSPWVTKKQVIRELIAEFEQSHDDQSIIDLIKKVHHSL